MKKRLRILSVFFLIIISACAVITVNIYFPEKDVKEAYKALEKELMKPEIKPEDKKPDIKPEGQPQSSIRFDIVSTAWAQEPGLAEKISEMIKKMPDVVNAYREMGARLSATESLKDSGMVGEGKNGMLVVREKSLSPADMKIVDAENENRKTVINGMAKAIIRINRQPETPENLRQVLPQATEQFSAIRRDSAKKGWWIQDQHGNWIKK